MLPAGCTVIAQPIISIGPLLNFFRLNFSRNNLTALPGNGRVIKITIAPFFTDVGRCFFSPFFFSLAKLDKRET